MGRKNRATGSKLENRIACQVEDGNITSERTMCGKQYKPPRMTYNSELFSYTI
ncbi:MAG: hypothetical protein KAQ62_24140 [Cyclobacteriaceae bacterium]|nr:hypothetical protein [Cyclobacteriaceae bacterium]MCK5371684.1 hypothetical protein [Cyclobacteriaceae bacterium]MCK5471159.1 hypothetical protein [Cyclobacteriaceae bacterium]MCK5704419.1 hypothetical protein [Cyclobacteriaceae bacterium]